MTKPKSRPPVPSAKKLARTPTPGLVVVVDTAPFRPRSGQHQSQRMKMRSLRPPVFRDRDSGQEFGTRAELRQHRVDYAKGFHARFVERLTQGTLTTDAWDKLPGETATAYARFRAYLTMDPALAVTNPRTGKVIRAIGRRSVERVAYHLGLNPETLGKSASHWHWKIRADAWDAHLDKVADEAFREEKRTAARRQARLGAKLQTLAGRAADNLLTQGALDVDATQLAKLADIGVKIERLAHGDSTSNDAGNATTVLVWQGARPAWADKGELVVEQSQIEAGPLGQKVIDARNGEVAGA